MRDKIVLVTGSSDGIGKQTAIDLARMGAQVIVHGRNPARAERALEEVREFSGSSLVAAVWGDLSSGDGIRSMADTLHENHERIDILINNAGVYKNQRELTRDGFELTFAVNHLSYFLLTGLLLDMLVKSASGRIVNVASQAHSSRLDFENLQGEKYYDAYDAYARSKLCNILFTYRLAEKIKNSKLTANVLHPGVISTKLLHAGWGSGGQPVEKGSGTSVYLAASEEVEGISGGYFVNRKQTRSASISYDPGIREKLWQISEEMTGFMYRF